MIIRMRTTLIIDDRLLQAARKQAAERGTTLSAVVNDALRATMTKRIPERVEPFRMVTYGNPKAVVRHEPHDFARALEADDARKLDHE